MPLSDFRDTPGWQEAIDLGPKLVNLAEQLPASEEMGLSFQLRKVMVKLPASIALDAAKGVDSRKRLAPIVRLTAILDLIDKIYPALDTGDTRSALEQLADKVAAKPSGSIGTAASVAPAPAKVTAPAETEPAHPEAAGPKPEPADTPVLPSEVSVSANGDVDTPEPAAAEPTTVHVTAEPAADESAATSKPDEDSDVHPDSV